MSRSCSRRTRPRRTPLPDADVAIGDIRQRHRLDRDTLAQMKRCRLIQQPSAGFDASTRGPPPTSAP
ncbi:MAG TPA: hypothetical protein VGG75_35955 [Trebonia sp.]